MREEFSDAQIAGFLQRSYFAVDGLWFVKTEEARGFDEAMKLDEAVWSVLSKIQARKARELLGIRDDSVESLARAFQIKLTAEGYSYDVQLEGGEARITIQSCPWYEILKSTERTQIAEPIADRICAREFAGWAREFSADIDFEIIDRLCVATDNSQICRIVFRLRPR